MHWAVLAVSLISSGAALADDAADNWKAKCKSCHGEDGKAHTRMGQKEKIADFTSPEWQKHNSDDSIRDVIANGSKENAKMKAFKERLSPEEIDGLVKYIRGMNKP